MTLLLCKEQQGEGRLWLIVGMLACSCLFAKRYENHSEQAQVSSGLHLAHAAAINGAETLVTLAVYFQALHCQVWWRIGAEHCLCDVLVAVARVKEFKGGSS
jgi:hypothetical protein